MKKFVLALAAVFAFSTVSFASGHEGGEHKAEGTAPATETEHKDHKEMKKTKKMKKMKKEAKTEAPAAETAPAPEAHE